MQILAKFNHFWAYVDFVEISGGVEISTRKNKNYGSIQNLVFFHLHFTGSSSDHYSQTSDPKSIFRVKSLPMMDLTTSGTTFLKIIIVAKK